MQTTQEVPAACPAEAGLTGAGALLQRLGHERVGDVLQPRTVLQPHGLQPEDTCQEGGLCLPVDTA